MRRGTEADSHLLKSICDKLDIPCPDPERILNEPRNIVLFDGDNAAMFLWRWVGIYEGHVLYTVRGKEAESLARKMLETMSFAMILAVTPGEEKPRRKVGLFLRKLGFAFQGAVETIEGLAHMYQLETCR